MTKVDQRSSPRSFAALAKKVGLAVVALGVVFVLADSCFRVYAHLTYSPVPESVLYEDNPALGAWWHRPNSRMVVTFRGTNPHIVSYNAFGMRGPSPKTVEKPAGVFRIVILGESSTEDAFVADGKSWPEVLERQLNAALGSNRIEVLNLGCAGYSLKTSLRNLEVNGLRFKPDMVITYHGNNDFWKAFMAWPHVKWVETHVDYEKRPSTWLERLLCKSILIDRLNRQVYYAGGARNRAFLHRYWSTPDAAKTDMDLTGVEAESDRELARLLDLSRTNGFRLVLGIQATLIKRELTEPELLQMWEVLRWSCDGQLIRWGTFVDGVRRVKDLQRQFAFDHGLPCIDVEEAVPKSTANFIDHIHSTEHGSAAIAGAMSQYLLEHEELLITTRQ